MGNRSDPEAERLRAALKEARVDAGLTQKELALLLGRHQSFVSKYERGGRSIGATELRQICSAIGISMGSLLDRLERAHRK